MMGAERVEGVEGAAEEEGAVEGAERAELMALAMRRAVEAAY